MQVLAPKPKIEERLLPVAEPTAQVSLRAVAGLEVASVVISVFISVWVIIPLQSQQRWMMAVPGLLALALAVNSHRLRGERFRDLGFSRRHFGRALRMVALPTLLACAVIRVPLAMLTRPTVGLDQSKASRSPPASPRSRPARPDAPGRFPRLSDLFFIH